MAKKKRKISKYNRHVAAEMKKGKSMSQAAASWNKKKSGSKKKPAKRKTSRSRKTTTRKQTTRRRGSRGQKTLLPLVNRMLFKGGPIRTRVGKFLGR